MITHLIDNVNGHASNQIDKIREACLTLRPKLVVFSMVFNHAPFLKDYFEGIISQKTNFPFVVIIHDDASTDGSKKIITKYSEKYPEIINPIFEDENQYSKRNGEIERIMCKVIDATGAKYVAFCEGDDYWIDPLKLQKQVDFMESHHDYGFVHTNVYSVHWESDYNKFVSFQRNPPEGEVYNQLLERNFIFTPTVLVRKCLVDKLRKEVYPVPYLDRIMWLCFSRYTKFHYLQDITSVYRVLKNSATHGEYKKILDFDIKCTNDILTYLSKTKSPQTEINKCYQSRLPRLLKYSYFAEDENNLKKYWHLIKTNSKPSISDYAYYWMGRLKIPVKLADFLKQIKRQITGRF